ncbi:hypothetical protein HK104_005512, partial [Borealophlyctis nickersoniae]
MESSALEKHTTAVVTAPVPSLTSADITPYNQKQQQQQQQQQRPTTPSKTLLLFVHGFLGSEASFATFPIDLVNHLREIHKLHSIEARVFPRFDTKGDPTAAVNQLCNWLLLNAGAPEYDSVVIIAHSMGGIMAVDAYRKLKALTEEVLGPKKGPKEDSAKSEAPSTAAAGGVPMAKTGSNGEGGSASSSSSWFGSLSGYWKKPKEDEKKDGPKIEEIENATALSDKNGNGESETAHSLERKPEEVDLTNTESKEKIEEKTEEAIQADETGGGGGERSEEAKDVDLAGGDTKERTVVNGAQRDNESEKANEEKPAGNIEATATAQPEKKDNGAPKSGIDPLVIKIAIAKAARSPTSPPPTLEPTQVPVKIVAIISMDSPFYGLHSRVYTAAAGSRAASIISDYVPPIPVPASSIPLASSIGQALQVGTQAVGAGLQATVQTIPTAASAASQVVQSLPSAASSAVTALPGAASQAMHVGAQAVSALPGAASQALRVGTEAAKALPASATQAVQYGTQAALTIGSTLRALPLPTFWSRVGTATGAAGTENGTAGAETPEEADEEALAKATVATAAAEAALAEGERSEGVLDDSAQVETVAVDSVPVNQGESGDAVKQEEPSGAESELTPESEATPQSALTSVTDDSPLTASSLTGTEDEAVLFAAALTSAAAA